MPAHDTETPEHRVNDRGDGTDVPSRAKGAVSNITRYGRNGSTTMLVGGALLARAVRTTRNRRRAAIQVLVGSALLGLGLRQRRSDGRTPAGEDGIVEFDDDGEKVSDDARAARERHDVMHQPETNPRGTSDEPEVETKTDPGDGEIRFTDQKDVDPQPHLDEEDPKDPRYQDADDQTVEVDLSEAAMADEASEAVGPEPEQAQPAQTEDTEPESSAPEDVSHMETDVPVGTDAEEPANEGEDEATDGGEEREAEDDTA